MAQNHNMARIMVTFKNVIWLKI